LCSIVGDYFVTAFLVNDTLMSFGTAQTGEVRLVKRRITDYRSNSPLHLERGSKRGQGRGNRYQGIGRVKSGFP
jgi:hypothetical protein